MPLDPPGQFLTAAAAATRPCDHRFAYAGVRYHDGKQSLPGTGATQRYYAHVYYCDRCTTRRGEPIADPMHNGRPAYSSYDKVHWNATPGSADDCGVPRHDR
jgi:hypothetical protein